MSIKNGFRIPFVFLLGLLLTPLILACTTDDHNWTDQDRKASDHYYNTQRANREASRQINKAGNRFSPQEKASIRALTLYALTEAQAIDDAFLDKVHPNFKTHFRGEFQAALEMALHNLDSPDYNTAKKSTELFSNFVDWYNENRPDIHMPDLKH